MRIRRLTEKYNTKSDWYYEIRELFSNGDYEIVEIHDGTFDGFNWDDYGKGYRKDEEMEKDFNLYAHLLKHIRELYVDPNPYILVKVQVDVIPEDEIDIILQTKKFNL